MSKNPRNSRFLGSIWSYVAVGILVIAAYAITSALPLVQEGCVRAIMFAGVGACAVLAIAVYIAKKANRTESIILLILLAGVIMRIGYMVYTPLGLRGHDVVGIGDSGNLDYIYQIFSTGKLPQTNEYQFYHPPVNYILEAIVVKGFALLRPEQDLGVLLEASKIVPCFASCSLLIVCYSLLRELRLSLRASAIALAVLAFQPTFYIFSASINNDSLMLLFYMIAALYTVRWYNKPSMKNILIIAVAIGLAMTTKLSGMTIAAFTAPVFLILLVRRIKEKHAIQLIRQYTAFAVVSFPLGLWYMIRNKIMFHQRYRYVYSLHFGSDLYCGDQSFLQRFLSFPLDQIFNSVYCQPYTDYNVWLYVLKCSVFGEYTFDSPDNLAKLLIAANLILILLSLAAMVYVVIRGKELHPLARFGLIWIWLIQIGSFVMFNIEYPFGCTMDFRYIVPAVIVGAAYLGVALDRLKMKKRIATSILYFAGIAAIVLFSAASVLFYTA